MRVENTAEKRNRMQSPDWTWAVETKRTREPSLTERESGCVASEGERGSVYQPHCMSGLRLRGKWYPLSILLDHWSLFELSGGAFYKTHKNHFSPEMLGEVGSDWGRLAFRVEVRFIFGSFLEKFWSLIELSRGRVLTVSEANIMNPHLIVQETQAVLPVWSQEGTAE